MLKSIIYDMTKNIDLGSYMVKSITHGSFFPHNKIIFSLDIELFKRLSSKDNMFIISFFVFNGVSL